MTDVPFHRRLQHQLLRLRSAGALALEEVPGVRDVHRFRFRVGGHSIVIDLDSTVLELRAYRGNDTIAVGPVESDVMSTIVGRLPMPSDYPTATAEEARADLRSVVSEWARKNARVHMSSPDVARHPDGWNHS